MSTQNNKKAGGKADNDFYQQMVFRYFPYWPLFILLLLLSGAAAWVYLKYKIPVYESSASILIKDEQKGLDDSKMMQSFNLFSSKKIVENEMEVLKSRDLWNEAVKNLHLYAPIHEKGTFANPSAYRSSPVRLELKNPDELEPVD